MTKLKLLVLFMFVLALPLSVRADSDVSFASPSGTIFTGSLFTLPVQITDVNSLAAYVFDVSFTPSTLQLVSISEGSFLPSAGPTLFFPGTIDNLNGLAAFTFDIGLGGLGASGSGDLADFTFLAVGAGPGSLSVQNAFLFDTNGNFIPTTTEDVNFSVRQAPEPATLALVGVSAVYLYVRRRKLGSL